MLDTTFTDTSAVFGGHLPGPTLRVDAPPEMLSTLTRRLSQVPSLPRMRGALVLGDAMDLPVDACLEVTGSETGVTDTLWHVLAAATELGMIAGRGVPRRYLETPAPLAFPLAP